MRKNDFRAKSHPAYWAFIVHRLSGLALAFFIPVHFWALGKALSRDGALNDFLHFTDKPLFKFAEWGLVILLSLHLMGGLRLLAIEFLPWSGLRKNWVALGAGASACTGLAFLLALVH
jgi:fumarate reductase subunit D